MPTHVVLSGLGTVVTGDAISHLGRDDGGESNGMGVCEEVGVLKFIKFFLILETTAGAGLTVHFKTQGEQPAETAIGQVYRDTNMGFVHCDRTYSSGHKKTYACSSARLAAGIEHPAPTPKLCYGSPSSGKTSLRIRQVEPHHSADIERQFITRNGLIKSTMPSIVSMVRSTLHPPPSVASTAVIASGIANQSLRGCDGVMSEARGMVAPIAHAAAH